MKIWLVQTGEPLPLSESVRNMRTGMFAKSLIHAGHSILWWTSAFDHLSKKWLWSKDTKVSLDNGINVLAIKGTGYRKNISLARVLDHRRIAYKFRKIARRMDKPEILVVSMPPHDLAYEAVMYADENNIPVIVDIRDPWPDIFLQNIPSWARLISRKLLSHDFKMIKYVMRRADGLVSVSDSFRRWGLRYAGRQVSGEDRVFYLGSKRLDPVSERIQKRKEKIISKYGLKGKFIVLFIGTFANYHDPSILLDCARELAHEPISFVLAGSGEFFERLKRQSESLPNIHLPGWLDHEDIQALLSISHVGICPTTRDIDLFPNKAFTYFSAGLPVISAFDGELKEIIEKEKIGFNFRPGDIAGLSGYIKMLHDDRKLLRQMSERVSDVFLQKFDADKIYGEYASYVEDMAKSGKK